MIGTHSGSYGVYRALAVAAGNLTSGHRADLTDTVAHRPGRPVPAVGRSDEDRLDRSVGRQSSQTVFADYLAQGYDIRPTIAVTKAHIAPARDQAGASPSSA